MKSEGIEFEWGPEGHCPVQAEGTFDGVPFYFRARGTRVTVDVGGWKEMLSGNKYVSEEWSWDGPEYEWPDAGWIRTETAMAFIHEAYEQWKHDKAEQDTPPFGKRFYKSRTDYETHAHRVWSVATMLKEEDPEKFKDAIEWLFAHSQKLRERKKPVL